MLEFLFKLDVAMHNGFSQPARMMANELQKLGAAGEKMQARLGQVKAYEQLQSQVKTSGTNLEYLRASMTQAALNVQQNRARTEGLAGEYESAKKRVQEWSATMPKNSMMLMTAKKRAEELGRAYRESQKQTAQSEREYEKLYRKVGEGTAVIERQKSQLSGMDSELRKAGINTNNLAGEQDKLTNSMNRLNKAQSRISKIRETLSWGNLKSVFMDAAKVVMPIKPLVKISGDFEEAMQKVKAVGFSSEGADLTQFYQMREQALKLGAETSFTSIQAANAQENLIRAGFNPEQTMQAMPGLLNMAAAEGLDLAQAAAIIAGSLNTIGLKAKDAGKLADMFAYASANSSTNIANIGEAFKGTASTAHAMGVRAEQLTAILMTLANMQIESSEAGTAVSSTFARLSKEPKAVAEALAQYKIAIQTREGYMRELPDIVSELYKVTTPLGAKKRMQAFANVFGLNYSNAMIALAEGALKGDTARYENELRTKAPGQAQRMTNINLDSLNGQLTILGSALDGLKISLGDMFSPLVREGVELLTKAISGLNDIIRQYPKEAKFLTYTITTLASAKAIAGVYNIGKAILSLPAAWLEYSAASVAANTAATAATGATSIAVGVLLFKIGLVIAALAALYVYWDDIKKIAQEVGENTKAAEAQMSFKHEAVDMNGEKHTINIPALRHASGGIMTRAHYGLVAESGPEAIVPLRDKSRGREVLMQAANILGMHIARNDKSGIASQAMNIFTQSMNSDSKSNGQIFMTGAANIIGRYDRTGIASGLMNIITQTQNQNQNNSRRSITEIMNTEGGVLNEERRYTRIHNNDVNHNSNNIMDNRPISNVNVNVSVDGRNSDDMSLASRIAQAVREALSEIMNDNMRLNYA